MNILIITTYFPPDTTIAAVRPYMFAKYLRQAGHNVTVLRSGRVIHSFDNSLPYDELGIRVFSYLGDDSPAERFARGEEIPHVNPKRKLGSLPEKIRYPMAWVYRRIKRVKYLYNAFKYVKLQKRWIDAHRDERFDVVFATFGDLENVYAGKYAAEVFGCKWILDLRDPIARRSDSSAWEYRLFKRLQEKAVLSCDACTVVSQDVGEQISAGTDKKAITLYNGYDDNGSVAGNNRADDVLRIAYTGILYDKQSSALPLFAAVRQLSDAGKVSLDKVRLDYAGPHFDMLLEQAKVYGVESILINHGVVGRKEAAEIQRQSDVFLVLSWNMKHEKGVLTGKFFEGIRARKPILTLITGDVPNSELNKLNEKYHYGFCYEACAPQNQFDQLSKWVGDAYTQKQNGMPVSYAPDTGLFTDFCYDRLTQKLEKICRELVSGTQ